MEARRSASSILFRCAYKAVIAQRCCRTTDSGRLAVFQVVKELDLMITTFGNQTPNTLRLCSTIKASTCCPQFFARNLNEVHTRWIERT